MILGKKDGQIDLSWNEICSALNMSCKQDYLRKFSAGIYAYRNFLQRQREAYQPGAGELDKMTELENKEFSFRREKIRMQDQRRMVNKGLREWARAERIEEVVRDAVKQVNIETPLPEFTQKKQKALSGERKEGVLLLSDWHVGMCTDNIVNQFDSAVLKDRVEVLTQAVIDNGNQQDIQHLHVFCLGDLVHGLIHVTARIDQEEDVVHQCMAAAELLSRMLHRLSYEFPITVYWSRGNYDRVMANKKESIARESFADLILWYMKERLSGYDISFYENESDDEIIMADICGHHCLAVHGHKDKPAKAVQNLSLMTKTFPDYIFMGHYHANAERDIQGAEVIVNGSLCGTDDYALALRRTSTPSQKFMIFNRDGRYCTYNVRLD